MRKLNNIKRNIHKFIVLKVLVEYVVTCCIYDTVCCSC